MSRDPLIHPDLLPHHRSRPIAGLPTRLLAILLLAGLLTGCSHSLLMRKDLIGAAEAAMAAGNLRQADALMAAMPAGHRQRDKRDALQQRITMRSADYARRQQHQAERLAAAGQWQQAFAALEQAQATLPPGTVPEHLQHTLRQRQQAQRQAIQASLLLTEARWRRQQQDNLQALAAMTDQEAAIVRQQWQQRQAALVAELTLLGHHYADQQDWQRAADLLRAAHALAAEQASPRLQQVEQQLTARKQQRQADTLSALQQQANAHLHRYQQSQQLDELISGRAFLQRHRQQAGLDALRTRFDMLAQQRFETALGRGDALYSQGHYRDARQQWQAVAALFPNDPGLIARLERVARVLDTIDSLSDEAR